MQQPHAAAPPAGGLARIRRVVNVEAGEGAAAICGFAFFFCLFTGYFMLRPIRETLGIAAGVDKLQWLFTATFVVMLAAVPCFGWLAARVPRANFVTWVYAFFAATLAGFAAWLYTSPQNAWAARSFYVWLSVFNLFVVSVAWSLMADVFHTGQAKRLFAFIAAGASTGGLIGPLIGGTLAGVLGAPGLILLSAALLAITLPLKSWLMRWRGVAGSGAEPESRPAFDSPARPMGGSILAGATRTFASPYLMGIAAFVILLATASTFLYMEQARLVADAFSSSTERIRVFSALDFTVQLLSMLAQLFLTGRLAQRYGVTFLLAAVPLLVCLGFLALAAVPTFAVLAAVMVLRRVGEYALVRPGREMLFTTVDAEAKYKAKNFIDTVVYRAGDAISAWAKTGVDALGHGVVLVALVGAACAAIWTFCGYLLGRRTDTTRG